MNSALHNLLLFVVGMVVLGIADPLLKTAVIVLALSGGLMIIVPKTLLALRSSASSGSLGGHWQNQIERISSLLMSISAGALLMLTIRMIDGNLINASGTDIAFSSKSAGVLLLTLLGFAFFAILPRLLLHTQRYEVTIKLWALCSLVTAGLMTTTLLSTFWQILFLEAMSLASGATFSRHCADSPKNWLNGRKMLPWMASTALVLGWLIWTQNTPQSAWPLALIVGSALVRMPIFILQTFEWRSCNERFVVAAWCWLITTMLIVAQLISALEFHAHHVDLDRISAVLELCLIGTMVGILIFFLFKPDSVFHTACIITSASLAVVFGCLLRCFTTSDSLTLSFQDLLAVKIAGALLTLGIIGVIVAIRQQWFGSDSHRTARSDSVPTAVYATMLLLASIVNNAFFISLPLGTHSAGPLQPWAGFFALTINVLTCIMVLRSLIRLNTALINTHEYVGRFPVWLVCLMLTPLMTIVLWSLAI